MSFTTTDLSNIESAIGTGELTVEIDGKRITYRSVDDLIKARDLIRADLQSTGAIASSSRTSFAVRSRA